MNFVIGYRNDMSVKEQKKRAELVKETMDQLIKSLSDFFSGDSDDTETFSIMVEKNENLRAMFEFLG